jgi:DNA-binding GntR family transcriptional regulator
MSTDAYPSLDTQTHTASAIAYQELKSWILVGKVPIGVRLREERIAERIGVSRTPVREAMLRLHAERFLERHAEGGYRVATPSPGAINELYEIRLALELFAIHRCAGGAAAYDRAALEALREEWSSIDADVDLPDPEFVLLDEEFHRRLAEAAGNRELAAELRRVNERIRPIRSHDFVTPGRIAATIVEHLGILEAVVADRDDRAAVLLEDHIRESQSVAQGAAALALERMLAAGSGEGTVPW